MAGILDSKTRMLDFILTDTGKEQLRDGRLRIDFASYTDGHTFYEGSEGVADSATNRLLLEAFRRVQDKIVPEALVDGRLLNFQSGDLKLFDAGILSGTAGEILNPEIAVSAFNQFLSGSSNNFSQNRILSELDEFKEDVGFSLSQGSIEFTNSITILRNLEFSLNPFSTPLPTPIIPNDRRFTGLTNYFYRPPQGLLPDEDVNEQSNNEISKYIAPDPRPFGSAFDSTEQRLRFAGEFKRAAEAAYGSRRVDIRSEENDDLILQGYLQIGGTELTKFVTVPLAVTVDGLTEYFLLGKVTQNSDGSESFIDALMLVLNR
jgi:hypothetical protein